MERVFVFDAYGTLLDLNSMQPRLEALWPGYGSIIMQLWRLKQLEYSWLRVNGRTICRFLDRDQAVLAIRALKRRVHFVTARRRDSRLRI